MYRKVLVGRIARQAVKVITVSAFQKKLIVEKLGIDESKIEVIHNGVDAHFFDRINADDLKSKLQSYGLKRGYIFFMSNSAPRKNTLGVLNAYAKLLTLNSFSPRLLMKGINESELMQMLKYENLLWLRGYIDMIGYIPTRDLPAIYQGASMLWFPSFSEGFGLPIIEAMASGTPVVTSSISCMPEIAGDAAMLVNPHAPREIAKAAYQILNLPLLAYSLAKAGQKRAATFTCDATTKKTVAIYHEIEKAI